MKTALARMVILQKRVPGTSEASLDRFVTRAKRALGLRGAVTVLVTTSRELQTLNGRFRGKHKPTDVLSFPAEVVGARRFAGDVAISAELAARNARQLGHSTAEEVKILVLHGLLHLAGYDHESDEGEMGRREERLRKKLGLPVALIERSGRIEETLNRKGHGETPQSARRKAAGIAGASRTSGSPRRSR
jgi:probable rRNA maturation factor